VDMRSRELWAWTWLGLVIIAFGVIVYILAVR